VKKEAAMAAEMMAACAALNLNKQKDTAMM